MESSGGRSGGSLCISVNSWGLGQREVLQVSVQMWESLASWIMENWELACLLLSAVPIVVSASEAGLKDPVAILAGSAEDGSWLESSVHQLATCYVTLDWSLKRAVPWCLLLENVGDDTRSALPTRWLCKFNERMPMKHLAR